MDSIANGVKNGVVCKCDRNILSVNSRLFRAVVENKNVAQELAEELAAIFGVTRCVIFKIFGAQPQREARCKIVAGVPIDGHTIVNDPLAGHPDIQIAHNSTSVELIPDPLENPSTQYFRGDVIRKGINQILYVPLIKKVRQHVVTAVIVMDAVGSETFSEEQILFCECLREIISNTLDVYDFFQQDFQDRLRNPAAIMGGFSKLIEKKATIIETRSWEIAVAAQTGKFAMDKMEEVKLLAREIAYESRKIEALLDKDQSGIF